MRTKEELQKIREKIMDQNYISRVVKNEKFIKKIMEVYKKIKKKEEAQNAFDRR